MKHKRTLPKYDMLRWHQYDYLKQKWIDEHPESTPQEYNAAMNAIAKKLGV